MSNKKKDEKATAVYVSLYNGEPVTNLTEQIQQCLQAEHVLQKPSVEVYGDIEDPRISIADVSLDCPTHHLTITKITPHNGKWSGFHLLATKIDSLG